MAGPATTAQGRGREQWPWRPRGLGQRPRRRAGGGSSGRGGHGGWASDRGAGLGAGQWLGSHGGRASDRSAGPATAAQGRGREHWLGRPRWQGQRPWRRAEGGSTGRGGHGGWASDRGAGLGAGVVAGDSTEAGTGTTAQSRVSGQRPGHRAGRGGAAASAGGGCHGTMQPLRQRPRVWGGQRSTGQRGQQRRQLASGGRVGVEASAGERGGGDGGIPIDPPPAVPWGDQAGATTESEWTAGRPNKRSVRPRVVPVGPLTAGHRRFTPVPHWCTFPVVLRLYAARDKK